MFDFTSKENLNKEYKGFILLSIDELKDYTAKGIFLRHKTTGLEIYHMVKEDPENLFAFAFRTISKDSKGCAHIMEHSTLCGSEKYPLKEPFTTLAGQSINTFLNALTYPDKTVYPAASLVKDDYFNMMDVYADSVFFPKLDYETFIQEGHRLEIDEKNKLSIQGVVYNEMKGEYSSFSQVAFSDQISEMYPESYPSFDSGGDPLSIPDLTYEEFLNFHQKFYNPDNCLLFLYGDIPTGQQLDFLNERFISRIEKKYNCKSNIQNFDNKLPNVKLEIQELQKLKLRTKSEVVRKIAPETGATGNLVTMNWYSGVANVEKNFLSEVLFGNDSSPLSKAIKESNLGDDFNCLNFGQFQEEVFMLGLGGVKKKNENKLFKIIEDTINKLAIEGVSQQDIDSAIMGIDFYLREVNRYSGPYSISIMSKALKGWACGKPCAEYLFPITDFEKLKEKIYSDKDFVKKLIKKYFIDNKIVTKIITEPSPDYFKNREAAEKTLIKKLEKTIDKESLKRDLNKLHENQQRIETEEETACIPHTKIENLPVKINIPEVEFRTIKKSDNSEIPLFISNEETNGIFYIDVMFPFDNLGPENYKYIPLLTDTLTNMGWNNKKWDKCISESSCVMGDIWGKTITGRIPDIPDAEEFVKKHENQNLFGRYWIGLTCKALTERCQESLNLLSEIINTMSFSDEERFKTILQESITEQKYSIVPGGRELAGRRSRATSSKNTALSEIMYGVTQLYTMADYEKQNPKDILKKFEELYYSCLKNGGIIHITADKDSLKKIIPMVEDFTRKSNITEIKPAIDYDFEDYLKNIVQVENIRGNDFTELIEADTPVGYAVETIPGIGLLTKASEAALIFSSWFEMHTLWDKIRTTGGAYGASATPFVTEQLFSMSSYRDPFPEKSLEAFKTSLDAAAEIEYSEEEIERSLVSCFGDFIVPLSPKDRGKYSFENFLYGTYGMKKKRIENLLKITAKDVIMAAKQLKSNKDSGCRKVIFGNKSNEYCGKILKLPL
ncbi:MAG: insulinase family protein [Treponema sp.]|nr:insulinase family protein [Treponema sp.]